MTRKFKRSIKQKKVRRDYRKVRKYMKVYSANLRKKATKAELVLKDCLNKNNVKFTFQCLMVFNGGKHKYIVDFYFPKKKGDKNYHSKTPGLIVEVDGGYHNNPKQLAKDNEREDIIMRNRNVIFLRFSNEEVLSDPEVVYEKIKASGLIRFNEDKLGKRTILRKAGETVIR